MKTLSEHEKDKVEEAKRKKDAHLFACRKLLNEVKESQISVYLDPNDDEYQKKCKVHEREAIRHCLGEGDVALLKIVCDKCDTQLCSPTPDTAFFTSGRPKKRFVCPGCGWSGFSQWL